MTAGAGRLRARFGVLRARRPLAAARIEDVLLGVRGRARLVDEVRALRTRVHELERDHLLLAAHVASLTARSGSVPVTAQDRDDEAARGRARLAAIAFYEERIGRLEQRAGLVTTRRHGADAADRVTIARTSDEPGGGRA
jgi:hypothetical protein